MNNIQISGYCVDCINQFALFSAEPCKSCINRGGKKDNFAPLKDLCRHCYNHISNNEIRAKFETKENADYFWGLYHEKVKGYCYYTNYIKKVFTENGVLMTRPQIDKYVSIFVKNDDDFNAFKAELQNTGYKNMPSKMRSDVRKYNHQVENQSKE